MSVGLYVRWTCAVSDIVGRLDNVVSGPRTVDAPKMHNAASDIAAVVLCATVPVCWHNCMIDRKTIFVSQNGNVF